MAVKDGITPLYTAYSPQSRRHHVVAWTHQVGAGKVFATTLGHDGNTAELGAFQHLVANGIAYVTERLQANGIPSPGSEGTEAVANYQATVTCQPSDVIDAATIEEVQAAVTRSIDENKSLKVISLRKSNSNSGSFRTRTSYFNFI